MAWLSCAAAIVCVTTLGCDKPDSTAGTDTDSEAKGAMSSEKTFGEDVEFLNEHAKTLVLRSKSGDALVAVTPEYQGRVMTSSATGEDGVSFGWINYKQVASGEIAEHINVYGGEERFWLGPEGGQFSIFFPPGAEFEFADWQTPPLIDTEPFDVVDQSDSKVSFAKEASIKNYSDNEFKLKIERDVEMLDPSAAKDSLGVDPGELKFVGYRTTNKVTNTGDDAWTKETGLLSVWLLGMYKPGPKTTIVVPYEQGDEAELGMIVNDTYFGKVPAERLKADDGVIYMSGDGEYRSKIGVSPKRAKDLAGSYDAERGVLTLVKYNKPAGVTDYVNSMWEIQDEPFAGDTVNAYNDGLNDEGTMLGPFYEIETSSPALALTPGESGTHISETYHFEGDKAELDRVAKETLGVSLEQIRTALD
ncbi:DUF6786 family protein [Aeoliella straminimaris]|nr:DUF6786 family protein [Aeoliella straminimaris]